MNDPILLEDLKAALVREGCRLGGEILLLEETNSTNDDARTWARKGAPHGALVLADAQRSGRGRNAHSWHSPKGENLYLSVILRPKILVAAVPALSLAFGIAVAELVEDVTAAVRPCEARIKWPNDVWVNRKKISGILLEAQFRGTELSHIVAGIGLNVHTEAFPLELAETATSLSLLGASVVRTPLVASLLRKFEQATTTYEKAGLLPFLAELNRRDALFGRQVTAEAFSGRAAGIDSEGRLRLADASGFITSVHSGEVSELRLTADCTEKDSRENPPSEKQP